MHAECQPNVRGREARRNDVGVGRRKSTGTLGGLERGNVLALTAITLARAQPRDPVAVVCAQGGLEACEGVVGVVGHHERVQAEAPQRPRVARQRRQDLGDSRTAAHTRPHVVCHQPLRRA